MAYYFINTMTDTNQLNWQRTNLENIETAWEGDLWDRKRLGIQLTNYVDRLQCGAVLALDARWGEGKTWFVRHWKKHLEDENHNVIYLDAFANDYLEDPFLVISSEITSCLAKDDNVSSHINTFKEKAAAAYRLHQPSKPAHRFVCLDWRHRGADGTGANGPSPGGWLRRAELGRWPGRRLRVPMCRICFRRCFLRESPFHGPPALPVRLAAGLRRAVPAPAAAARIYP